MVRIRTGCACPITKWWTLGREFIWLSLLLSGGDWLNPYINQAGLSLLGSDMTVCLDRPYLGCTFWFIQKFTIAYFLSPCLENEALQSEALPEGYLFPCSDEINGLFLCLTKIKIIFPMFLVPRNLICFPVPHRFGHLFPCSPEINVDLLFPHRLGGSKQTVLLVYVHSKTMHHTRIWLTGKFNTPALGKIEMVQCRVMHKSPGPGIVLRGYSGS